MGLFSRKSEPSTFKSNINTAEDVARINAAAREEAARNDRYYQEKAQELAARRAACPASCHRGCQCR